ncbi:ankyrin repeat-containing domain protein [Flagelloscypha sp. PMI_526]|nr:ankyrin repeat-containing domain protein [Flagelloscypha sp. PMI_526]
MMVPDLTSKNRKLSLPAPFNLLFTTMIRQQFNTIQSERFHFRHLLADSGLRSNKLWRKATYKLLPHLQHYTSIGTTENNIKSINALDESLVQFYLSFASIRVLSNDTKNLLHSGTEIGSPSLLKYMLDENVPMNHQDDRVGEMRGDSVLHTAVRSGHRQCVVLLLLLVDQISNTNRSLANEPFFGEDDPISKMVGASMRTIPRKKDALNILHINEAGETALSLALLLAAHDLATLLTEYIASRNPIDAFGNSAIHIETKQGHSGIIRRLLDQGVNPVVQNIQNESPLYIAHSTCKTDIVDLLLDEAVKTKPTDELGNHMIHLETIQGRSELVDMLVSRGDWMADEPNFEGRSALHLAAYHGHKPIVEILLKQTYNPDTPDKNGATPYALACEMGHMDIMKKIIRLS